MLIFGLVATSCAAPSSDGAGSTDPPQTTVAAPSTTTATEPAGPNPSFETAPAVLVRSANLELALDPWTACWSMACYDGAPPAEPLDIGVSNTLIVEFPVEGWTFQATVRPAADECGRRQTETLVPIDGTRFQLTPIGLAGNHIVDLFGRGDGQDVIVTFAWTTTVDGKLPVPTATTSILANHDGAVDSYGVELSLSNLAFTPSEVAAEATVTAVDGASHTFALTGQDVGCTVGSLFLSAPIEEGLTASQIGEGPYTYEVRLTLDGFEFTGTAIWPADEDPECAPCVPLTFEPPLEALEGLDDRAIEASQIDGIWVFSHNPRGGGNALHGGTATIENGCLYVDGAVVVWHTESLDDAKSAIEAVHAGEAPSLSIGGGGISLEEGATSLPSEVTDLCPTSTVWFGAP